jgi:SAM-dependent methyltransferase
VTAALPKIQAWLRTRTDSRPALRRALGFVRRQADRALRGNLRQARVPLPPEARRARVDLRSEPARFTGGAAQTLAVELANESSRRWPGRGALALSFHWYAPDGARVIFDRDRTAVIPRLRPGGRIALECAVVAPNTPGPYVLEVDLVHGKDDWLGADAATPPPRCDVVVAGVRPETLDEIDYEAAYTRADLWQNYWGVVGPASAEEFARLGAARLEMLRSFGLTPSSSVLDVGCGTGSMAAALSGYLDEGGCYVGTDLSEVAVAFCRERYPRPNFTFLRNPMTSIPVAGRRFDFVVFFSVLTHTYPGETDALLAQARALLEPSGVIVADAFEADMDAGFVGTRAMLVLPKGRIERAAAALGLSAETVGAQRWDPTDDRPIDRVLRRFAPLSGRTGATP